jgi:RNA polymerase sigma factor (sigma-70 family)
MGIEVGGDCAFDPLLRRRASSTDVDLAALFEMHHNRLRGLAAAITFDRDLAEEIVQDAFAGLISHGDRVGNVAAYLHRSVVNLSVTQTRRRERARKLPLTRIGRTAIPDVDEVWDVLEALPVRQRAVIILRFYEDLSYEQIADTVGIPIGSVKSALHRALSALKEQL